MEQQVTERSDRRSRSKTPAIVLRVSAEREINGGEQKATTAADKKVKKVPTVTTIVEEHSSSQKTTTESSPGSRVTRQVRTMTSDYSSDGHSPDKASSKQSANSTTITTSITTTSSKTVTVPSSKTTQEIITSIRQSPAKMEIQQNELNEVLEDRQTGMIRTSTPKVTSKTRTRIDLTTEELREHAAYKEYREAGEYWNKYPKTDYTYSELSPHRREIIPGVIAMPNMSRPGLNKHTERVNVMIQRDPTQEAFIRKRYSSAKYSSAGVAGGSFAHADPYDSGEDSVDWRQIYKSPRKHMSNESYRMMAMAHEEQRRSIVSRVFLTIVHFFYSITHSVSRLFNRSEHNLYYTRIEDERGFLLKTYSFFTTLVTSIFKNVYLVISKVLFLDTWLLQTSSNDIQQGRRKRKFLLLLLTLLPFLLFGGIFLYLDPTPLKSFRDNLANPLLNHNFHLDLPDTDAVKTYALEKWDGVREFTGFYFDNMKLFSENVATEIQKIWQENVKQLF